MHKTPEIICGLLAVNESENSRASSPGAQPTGAEVVTEVLLNLQYQIVAAETVRAELELMREAVLSLVENNELDILLLIGGEQPLTSLLAAQAIEPLLSHSLPGFGELYRQLLYNEIGPPALLSQVLAGMIDHTALFLLPGEGLLAHLAMSRLVAPILPALTAQLRQQKLRASCKSSS